MKDFAQNGALCPRPYVLARLLPDDEVLLKRLTLVIRRGTIDHAFYPVFPPDRHPEEILDWLQNKRAEHLEA